jgi:WD40 repeat protein/predicted Ser/Thr protein kinase
VPAPHDAPLQEPADLGALMSLAIHLSPAERAAAIRRFCRAHPDEDEAELVRVIDEMLPATRGESPAPQAKDGDGQVWGGRYQVKQELGHGGQGLVYLAYDTKLHRKVALKVIRGLGVGSTSQKMLDRFRREAEVTSRLDHPGICTVYDTGVEHGMPFIAMRYVEGETLARQIAAARGNKPAAGAGGAGAQVASRPTSPAPSSGPRTWAELCKVLELIEHAARALHAAHEAGVIHRDIKPHNIMVTPEGEPVLLDFGLARELDNEGPTLTLTGELFGTPAYMSPEQLLGQRVQLDKRTDVYSLGVTLFECITWSLPFGAPTHEGLFHAIQTKVAPDPRRLNPAIPFDLKVVTETAIEKDRDRRYATALEFAEDLLRVRRHEPIRARPPGLVVRLRRWARAHPLIATGIAAAALVMSAALVLQQMALRRTQGLALAHAAAGELRRSPVLSYLLAKEAVARDPRDETTSQLHAAVYALREVALVQSEHEFTAGVFSPTGDRVILGDEGGRIWLWNTADPPAAPERLAAHRGMVTALAHAAHGGSFATAALDGSARVWRRAGERLGKELLKSAQPVTAIAFSPDGELIATVAVETGLQLWYADGRVRYECMHRYAPADTPLAVVFAPDGRHLGAVGGDGTARIFEVATGRCTAVLADEAGALDCIAFAPSGDLVAGAVSTRTKASGAWEEPAFPIQLWSLAGAKGVRLRGHHKPVGVLAFARDGSRLLSGSHDNTAALWRTSGERLVTYAGHTSRISAVTFSPREDLVLTAAWDTTARVFTSDSRPVCTLRGHRGKVYGAAFCAAGGRQSGADVRRRPDRTPMANLDPP